MAVQNVIISVPEKNGEGFKSIMISLSIIAKDEKLESQCQAVVEKFSEGRDLFNIRKEIIEREYTGWEDLLALITNANDLII